MQRKGASSELVQPSPDSLQTTVDYELTPGFVGAKQGRRIIQPYIKLTAGYPDPKALSNVEEFGPDSSMAALDDSKNLTKVFRLIGN